MAELHSPGSYNNKAGSRTCDGARHDCARSALQARTAQTSANQRKADGISSAFGATGSGTIGLNSTTGVVTQFTTTPIPAPSSLALAAGGLLIARRRRR